MSTKTTRKTVTPPAPPASPTPTATTRHRVPFTFTEVRKGTGEVEIDAADPAEARTAAEAMLRAFGAEAVLEDTRKFGSHRVELTLDFGETA
jgi:hypothetical protein